MILKPGKEKKIMNFSLVSRIPLSPLTSEVECSGARTRAKAAGESFFLHYLYAVLRAVNETKSSDSALILKDG